MDVCSYYNLTLDIYDFSLFQAYEVTDTFQDAEMQASVDDQIVHYISIIPYLVFTVRVSLQVKPSLIAQRVDGFARSEALNHCTNPL